MGFFSYLCAKTGLPIMAGTAAGRDEAALCEVIGLRAAKSKSIQGIYDGYGRVGSHGEDDHLADVITDGHLKLVLKKYYNEESFASLPANRHDSGQGYFHDWDFVKAAHELIDDTRREFETWYQAEHRPEAVRESGGGDSLIPKSVFSSEYDREAFEALSDLYDRWHQQNFYISCSPSKILDRQQWSERLKEYEALRMSAISAITSLFGIDHHLLAQASDQMDKDIRSRGGPQRWFEFWKSNVEPAMKPSSDAGSIQNLQPGLILQLFKQVDNNARDAARNEIIHAWRRSRPAAELNFQALILNPTDYDGARASEMPGEDQDRSTYAMER